MPVPAPAVGRFRRADAAAGAAVEEGAVIGTVRSGRRDTPVLAPFGGTVGGFAAEDGDFVEFGQPVATIAGREAT
jgi:biotin carboxyl carrier protein